MIDLNFFFFFFDKMCKKANFIILKTNLFLNFGHNCYCVKFSKTMVLYNFRSSINAQHEPFQANKRVVFRTLKLKIGRNGSNIKNQIKK